MDGRMSAAMRNAVPQFLVLPRHLVTSYLLAERADYVREQHQRSADARQRAAVARANAAMYREARLAIEKGVR